MEDEAALDAWAQVHPSPGLPAAQEPGVTCLWVLVIRASALPFCGSAVCPSRWPLESAWWVAGGL